MAAGGGTLAWLTFVAAATAAAASLMTAWRQWRNWSVDRLTARFEDALARSLSGDDVTSRTGREQLTGMVARGDLTKRDTGYVNDTLTGLLGPAGPAGAIVAVHGTPGDDESSGQRRPEQ